MVVEMPGAHPPPPDDATSQDVLGLLVGLLEADSESPASEPYTLERIRHYLDHLTEMWPARKRRYLLAHVQNLFGSIDPGSRDRSLAQVLLAAAWVHLEAIGGAYPVVREMARPTRAIIRDLEIQPPPPSAVLESLQEQVTFSVYGPSSVANSTPFILDLWAFTESQRAKVEAQVRARQQHAASPGATAALQQGAVLAIQVQSPFLDIDEPARVLTWSGQQILESFVCSLKPMFADKGIPASGSILITSHGLLIASIQFLVQSAAIANLAAGPLQQEHHEPKKAFCSYSSENRIEVLERIQGMQAVRPDLDLYLDIDKLRQGDHWEAALYEAISSSDILYLFWSAAAAKSQWVDREWRYGFGKKGLDFISPVPLESPQLVSPPAELGAVLNFNDRYLLYIQAQQRIDQLKALKPAP